MSHQQGQQPPQLGATFIPGGVDDYYMPAPAVELVSPAPQRIMPDVPENMQENIAALELEASTPSRNPVSPPAKDSVSPGYNTTDYPPQAQRGYSQEQQAPGGAGQYPPRQSSMNYHTPNVPTEVQPAESHDYSRFSVTLDIPNFSPFPKLENRPPNVPPTDDEKEAVLENARLPVLNSNDPEMQLAWAQDALIFVDIAMLYEQRISETQPGRPVTPQIEHQLRMDAMSIVNFLADQHHPKAEFMRGMWLEFGKFGLRQDKKEAFRCYSRAAEKGYVRAEYRMGMLFEQANDTTKSLVHYKRGSEGGDSASNYRLGMMTLLGQHGQPQDYSRGIQLIRLAAQTADENAPQGAYVLGMLQARELPQINVPEIYLAFDERSARQNIEKAAFLGFAKAQLKMGQAYELCTLGCDFNPALSLHYNALASRQGELEADMAISKWFLCGYEAVFQKNEELAYIYAQRAAQGGLGTAEFAMGYFNEIGMYVPVNLDKAGEWYEKAAKSGNKDAESRIQNISLSRTLSKKDHENVAIQRIRSQYGSRRGGRPERFQQQSAAPSLQSIPDNAGSREDTPISSPTGRGPDRNAATTPYPLSNEPPVVGNYSGPPPRSATTVPYPLADNLPQLNSRPGPGGAYFAPEMRSQSTVAAARPMSAAFNINPNIYGPAGGPPPPGGRMAGPPGNGPVPPRSYTSVGDMGRGRGQGLPPNPRIGSVGPPGPNSYRQPGGPPPGDNMANQQPQQPRLDIGYSAPPEDRRQKLQKPGPNSGKPSSMLDIGYQAPPEPKQPQTSGSQPGGRAATVQPGQQSRPAPQRSATAQPQGGRPGGSRADSATSLPSQPHKAQKPAQQKPQTSTAGPPKQQAPPGKGPKTFDEMGIGPAKQEGECIIM